MIIKKAYAKVNLGLQVVNKREDNYHNLKTVMTLINLYDELSFENHHDIILECRQNICKQEDNLVYKTAMLIKEKFSIKKGCRIKLNKNIPIGSGLAGGSADAAATIIGLNELWELNLEISEMINIGAKIGSDVPFCLLGKPAVIEGRGDIIKEVIDIPELYFIIVFPNFHCLTKDVFSKHQIIPNDNRLLKLLEAIKTKDISTIGKFLFNDLEKTVDDLFANEISKIKKSLLSSGSEGAIMSGSGSTVYGIAKNFKKAQKIKGNITKLFPKYHILATNSYKMQ